MHRLVWSFRFHLWAIGDHFLIGNAVVDPVHFRDPLTAMDVSAQPLSQPQRVPGSGDGIAFL